MCSQLVFMLYINIMIMWDFASTVFFSQFGCLMCRPTLSPLGGDMNYTLSNSPQSRLFFPFCSVTRLASPTCISSSPLWSFLVMISQGTFSNNTDCFHRKLSLDGRLLCGSGGPRMCFLNCVHVHIVVGWYRAHSVHSLTGNRLA